MPHLGDDAQEEAVIDVLREVGLNPETRFRYPHEFPAARGSVFLLLGQWFYVLNLSCWMSQHPHWI